ncbi:MAG: hypothetical protein ABMA26_00055 [Limisphaerales bacterium]
MKTHLKKMPISDQPHQPAKTHHLQAGTAETRAKAADTQAGSTAIGVMSGNEKDSTGHGSNPGASDAEPASPPTPLTDAQREVADRFRDKRAQPDSTDLESGLDLLDIIRNQRLPMRGGRILDSEQLLGLDRFEVRRLVEVAELHRAGQGGGSPALGADVRASKFSASKEPPASPPKAATGEGKSAASAPSPAPEKKRPVKMKEEATEANALQTGAPVQSLANPSVETVQPGPEEPTRAGEKTPEDPTGTGEIPSATRQRKKRQTVANQAADKATVGTTLTLIEQEQRLIQLETIVENGFTTLWEMGKAMLEIRDTKLYVKRYKTFERYCEQRWAKHRSRCYQLMDAAEVQQNLSMSTQVDISELTEKHCRELVKLKKPADQRTAWKEAAASADGTVSLVHLKQAVAKLRPPARPLPADKAPATAAPVAGAAEGTPDHAVPAETHEEPTTDQPESPPATGPAAFARDEFDLDEEWLVVEQTLTSLFRRCPKYRWPVLWKRLNGYFEKNPELIPAD